MSFFPVSEKKEAHLYYRPQPIDFYPEKQLMMTNVIGVRRLQMFHSLDISPHPNQIYNWIQMLSLFVWLMYTFLLALVWLLFVLIRHLIVVNQQSLFHYEPKPAWIILQTVFRENFSVKSHYPLSWIILYLHLMIGVWWFNGIFLGEINTNIITVDRKDIVETLKEAVKSKRQPCWAIGKYTFKVFAKL